MKTPLIYSAALIALSLSINAQAQIVDLFETAQSVIIAPTNTNDTAGIYDETAPPSDPTIIGHANLEGSRDLDLQLSDVAGVQGGGSIAVAGGQLNFATAPGVTGTGTIQWDGFDSDGNADSTLDVGRALDTDGLGGVDLVFQDGCPLGGCDRFEFLIFFSDAGGGASWNFTLGLWTDDNDWTEFDLIATQVNPFDTDGVLSEIMFSDFTSTDGCGETNTVFGGTFNFNDPAVVSKRCGTDTVDAENLGAIELAFNIDTGVGGLGTVQAIDLTIGAITKTGVPEPGILGLMGLGLAALGLVRRSRKGKA